MSCKILSRYQLSNPAYRTHFKVFVFLPPNENLNISKIDEGNPQCEDEDKRKTQLH